MMIAVSDALSFADLLKTSADTAVAAGQTEFDLTDAVQDKFKAALAEWNAAKSSGPQGS